VDEPASVFVALLADVAAYGLSGSEKRIARVMGEKMGRFIYIVDAVDDVKKDAKSGNFNPVLALFGENLTQESKEDLQVGLTLCLADMEAALDLVPDYQQRAGRAVIQNILYLGLPDAMRRVLQNETCRKEEDFGEQ
jgi:hypothetical protein